MNAGARPKFAKGVKLRREADGSAMLLVPEGALELNRTAAAALELVDGNRTFDDILAVIVECFDVSADQAATDLAELFERLRARGFVTLRRSLSRAE